MTTSNFPPVGQPAFDRVLIIMFENMYRSYVMQNPYMRGLAAKGIDLANCHGVMHPSQTNYIASVAGELCNVSDDERPNPALSQDTIVDLLERKGLAWKAYMDSYAPTPWQPDLVAKDEYPYVIKHDPFSSFRNILDNRERWAKIVDANQLFTDAANNQLPKYAWLTPDMWNDGHYLIGTQKEPDARAPALVDQQAVWLEYLFRMLKFPGPDSLLPPGTLVVVTYDEADFEASYDKPDTFKYTYDGPNQIYTVLLGSMIEPGVETEAYNHYSLLRTIEVNFGLDDLGKNDRDANWYQFLWGQRFAWGPPTTIGEGANGPVQIACRDAAPTLVYRDAERRLVARGLEGEASVVAPAGDEPFALAAAGGLLWLVIGTDAGIVARTHDGSGWSDPSPVTQSGPVGAIALAGFEGGAKLMLCWTDNEGRLASLTHADGAWASAPVAVGSPDKPFVTGGAVGLAVLGSCIFCIYEAKDSDALMVVTYNTADYNIITLAEATKYSGPYNDTTKDQWSPSAFPVERFASAPSPVSPGDPEPKTIEYPGRGPLALATLDGVVHLAHPGTSASQVVSETFSISGLLTPKLPVSYAVGEQTTTSNGYGTLAQAGWSAQAPVPGVVLGDDTPGLAMASNGEQLYLAHPTPSGGLAVSVGRYATATTSDTTSTPTETPTKTKQANQRDETMDQYLEPNPDAWQKIDHIVVVMLENRSFDCMLGWLYDGEHGPPPGGQHFEGLHDDISNNLEIIDDNGVSYLEQVYARRNGQPPTKGSYGVRNKAKYPVLWNLPAADPGEGFRDTNSQMFERWDVPNNYPPDPTMGGFAENYQNSMVYSSSVYGDDPVNPRQIMAAYTPDQLKVLSGLAQNYAVCDHWHCSVPSQTWPNRAFAFAATSEGNVNNRPDWVIEGDTLFDRLQDAIEGSDGAAPRTDLSWNIYSGTQDGKPFSLTKIMLSDAKQKRFAANFQPITSFYEDAKKGKLPSYSFLEPQFSGPGQNDQKPPSDVRPGEAFIARIYDALRSSPQWEKTMLVITYDEHGGCHDHVPPPSAKSPDGKVDQVFGFQFNRYGGRVPAVVVSPWIEAGVIARPKGYTPFDHTSIVASVINRFDLGDPLTERDKAAPDLSCLLTLASPRKQAPPVEAPAFDEESLDEVETGLQREVARILGQRLGECQGEGESLHDFIMRLAKANDAILASYDLTSIKGIGPAMRTALNKAGIFTIDELAKLSDADIDALDKKLDIPFKDDASELRAWVAQAKSLTA